MKFVVLCPSRIPRARPPRNPDVPRRLRNAMDKGQAYSCVVRHRLGVLLLKLNTGTVASAVGKPVSSCRKARTTQGPRKCAPWASREWPSKFLLNILKEDPGLMAGPARWSLRCRFCRFPVLGLAFLRSVSWSLLRLLIPLSQSRTWLSGQSPACDRRFCPSKNFCSLLQGLGSVPGASDPKICCPT